MPAQDILTIWFEQSGPQFWDQANDVFDAKLRANFEDLLLDQAVNIRRSNTHSWLDQGDHALALILLFDQFPRRIYRNTKGAYAFEDIALAAARQAIVKGFDLKTDQSKRWFFYSPFVRAEDLGAQSEGVRLIDMRIQDEDALIQAHRNRQIIAKFGRFASRNKVLGRPSTAGEIDFLSHGVLPP